MKVGRSAGRPAVQCVTDHTCTALVSAWPMCSAPVTLGGGMTMTKGGLVLFRSGLKKPLCSHQSYQPASTTYKKRQAGCVSQGGHEAGWVCEPGGS